MEPNLSVVFPDDRSMTFHNPEIMWNISDEAPHLLKAAAEREPALPAICRPTGGNASLSACLGLW